MSYYSGKIKVVGVDLLCFAADAKTLDAQGSCTYDPWAYSDPDPNPVETISIGEWNMRRSAAEALARERERR